MVQIEPTVLPTKTTCTDAKLLAIASNQSSSICLAKSTCARRSQTNGKLGRKKSDRIRIVRTETYAAVAPKISILLAVVKRARQIENKAEKARIMPRRSTILCT